MKRVVIYLMAVWCTGGPAAARTIMLTDRDVTQMATLNPKVPASGWSTIEMTGGVYFSYLLSLSTVKGILIRFPLDRLPPGQRIVNAELYAPIYTVQAGARNAVWRLLVDWGPGASHQYRRILPQRVEWTVAGADGLGVERALEPTAAAVYPKYVSHSPMIFNVTKDVELWLTGSAPNHGWLIAADEMGIQTIFKSPFAADSNGLWQLKITYEPQ